MVGYTAILPDFPFGFIGIHEALSNLTYLLNGITYHLRVKVFSVAVFHAMTYMENIHDAFGIP